MSKYDGRYFPKEHYKKYESSFKIDWHDIEYDPRMGHRKGGEEIVYELKRELDYRSRQAQHLIEQLKQMVIDERQQRMKAEVIAGERRPPVDPYREPYRHIKPETIEFPDGTRVAFMEEINFASDDIIPKIFCAEEKTKPRVEGTPLDWINGEIDRMRVAV